LYGGPNILEEYNEESETACDVSVPAQLRGLL